MSIFLLCFCSKREERERERELSSFHRFFQRDRMEFTALSRVQFLPRDFFVFSRGGSLHVDDRWTRAIREEIDTRCRDTRLWRNQGVDGWHICDRQGWCIAVRNAEGREEKRWSEDASAAAFSLLRSLPPLSSPLFSSSFRSKESLLVPSTSGVPRINAVNPSV